MENERLYYMEILVEYFSRSQGLNRTITRWLLVGEMTVLLSNRYSSHGLTSGSYSPRTSVVHFTYEFHITLWLFGESPKYKQYTQGRTR